MEVKINVVRELMTRTPKIRKQELKLDGKPTTEGQGHWIHSGKTKRGGR